jgi:rsbT co-antagonist protein RsbR
VAEAASTLIHDGIARNERSLLEGWLRRQVDSPSTRRDLIDTKQLEEQSRGLLEAIREASKSGDLTDVLAEPWAKARETVSTMARLRARQGFTSTETAWFVLSLKQPLFERLAEEIKDSRSLAAAVIAATTMLDRLGLLTTEVYQKSREEVIHSQQQEVLELSTPVVQLWSGILALPLIGTLDSNRTQVVMESLLRAIVQSESSIAILDITGVPTVDTLVAQHLLKTVAAARLMGADCIISGIRPQIAQTIVHLGVDLSSVTTKATLADAFGLALQRKGLVVERIDGAKPSGGAA